MNLAELKSGERGKIVALEGGQGFQERMSTMGVRVRKEVKVMAKQPAEGPLVIKIDNFTVTLGRGMARKVLVEKIE